MIMMKQTMGKPFEPSPPPSCSSTKRSNKKRNPGILDPPLLCFAAGIYLSFRSSVIIKTLNILFFYRKRRIGSRMVEKSANI
jgi:hypothetical protein